MRKSRMPPLAFLSVLLLGSAAIMEASQAQSFVQIAYIDEPASEPWGYDCDHDGWNELIFSSGIDTGLPNAMVKVYEHIGANNYQVVDSLLNYSFRGVGDLDGDGLTDFVTQSGWFPSGYDTNVIFESLAPNAYPEQLVWWGPTLYWLDYERVRISDLDQDGRKEMLRFCQDRLRIFECRGDNIYEQVFEELWGGPYYDDLCIGDFDRDGKMEFVSCEGGLNTLVACENTEVGVDSFAITWVDTLRDCANSNNIAGANDMDQDGWGEFAVFNKRGGGGCLTVFEAVADNLYEPVWSDTLVPGTNSGELACGDVDADGLDEICWICWDGLADRILLYKCVGPDSYELIWEEELATRPTFWNILIYDLNKNGYGEIVVAASDGIWIYEKEIIGVGESNDQLPMTNVQLMQNVPNPFTKETQIAYSVWPVAEAGDVISHKPLGIRLKVYDVPGRLVKTLVDGSKEPGTYASTWDGRDEAGRPVPSGIYFCRLEAGSLSRTCKMAVLR